MTRKKNDRDLLTEVKNETGTNVISIFQYANDSLGRRTQRVDTTPGGLSTNDFGYNTRSELVDADMGTNEFGYVYDPIGNRDSATNNGVTTTYQANQLNQYTNIANGVTNTPTFDADGNMLTRGDWTYTWNGENRLIQATNAEHTVSWKYDYRGRCFEKAVDGVTNRYAWDGFNIIAETSAGSTNYNVFGPDLSGSLQGAGGVGGLLATVQDGETYLLFMDGNGNVCQYVDTNGTIVATREYSPFGQTIALTGDKKDDFTHWWSTKPWCPTTGLSEYEFRKYIPALGRWLSRDPITEGSFFSGMWSKESLALHLVWEGSIYGYVHNDPIDAYDFLGLCRIWYNCTLKSSTGKCDKTCTYSCVEYKRAQPAFGPNTPCWEVPKPYTFAKQTIESGWKILGICCKKGKCKKKFSGIGTHGGGGIDCSKSGCKKGCKLIAKIAKKAAKDPVSKAAVLAAKLLCIQSCAICSKP